MKETMSEIERKREESFEDILRKLEENVAGLESGDLPLEEALKLFEEGIKLSKVLTKRLAEAEESVKKLVKTGEGEFALEDFEGEENDG
jgi:exodeoxyribonuclease VII small subunit